VPDLAAAARDLSRDHGLESTEGGRHPGWGTANRIVPLGATYLELIAVVDEREAAGSAFGRWVLEAGGGSRPLGWAVRTDDLDGVAKRLGLTTADGSRLTAEGTQLRWRYAGAAEAIARPPLPFFIEWSAGTPFPGRAAEPSPYRLRELRLAGDPVVLGGWLGEDELPLRVVDGEPGVQGVLLAGPAGELVL
jgi:glyoxalase-like protein